MKLGGSILHPGKHSQRGFTLVELMVAIAVLAVLCSLVLQLMGSATRLTTNSRQATDCDVEARYALNQISFDILKRIRRSDVSAYVDKQPGNDRFFLFSEAPGFSPSLKKEERSSYSLVGYRIRETNGKFNLERYARALPWIGTSDSPSMPYIAVPLGKPDAVPAPSSTLIGAFSGIVSSEEAENDYFQTLSENVIRMEISLLKKPDARSQSPSQFFKDSELEEELNTYGLSRVAAIVVTLAILDPQNSNRVRPEQINAFNATPELDTQSDKTPLVLPLSAWNQVILDQSATLTKPFVQGIRVYQRVIDL